ncbi:hypothetical protein E2562_009071 [Oryza meyeriana var. granulata]|uniref:Uncharacterized protein n=1 Tax=Oryza meyeriana var. granulata TaxID=110450 RepID=A0A6G1D136_9ORYZ|nr:hypothetical protein E2562_009071 [Oryza meyeriana var. granulata]
MASSPAIGASKEKLRISDYLLDDSDGGDAEVRRHQEAVAPASRPSPGTPPRLRIPGFTCARIRFVRLGRSRGCGGRKELAAEKSEAASSSADDASGREVAGSGSGSGASSSAATTEAAAGLGLSMLFLLARTSVELNKMAEVRAQMEALLREMRDEAAKCKRNIAAAAGRRDPQPTSSSTSSSLASGYSTDTVGADGHATSSPTNGEIEKPLQEEEEVEEWSDGEFIELDGVFRTGLRRCLDDDDRVVSGGGGEGGVSGVELERRLHELQHERDRERVAELEAALRRAERRLMEKEMEARLWKDTAELALAGRQ